jgi:uncharacterized membrane protein
MNTLLFAITFLALAGSALMAGLFFVFSNTIMAALGRLPPPTGIAAMQSINATILNPVFFLVFFGTSVLCAGLIVAAILNLSQNWALPLVAGALCYLVGSLLLTMVCNVPLNNRLAGAGAGSREAAKIWAEYLQIWTAWNHLRTALCLAATGLLTWALYRA